MIETVRSEDWGEIRYSPVRDEFSARVLPDYKPVPRAPIGVSWVITGACNLRCRHCYGNEEALPPYLRVTDDVRAVATRLAKADVMRVVISGGEPLIHKDIFIAIDELLARRVSVVLGTNGSLITNANVGHLTRLTRVEVSLDAADPKLNNDIRVSRSDKFDAWSDTLRAIRLCLENGVRVRVLTALNSRNQLQIPQIADVLADVGITDWALSPTTRVGRAAPIYDLLRPDPATMLAGVVKARAAHPNMAIRYSERSIRLNRYYFIVLPDGSVATEDTELGQKRIFGSLLERPVSAYWNEENYMQTAHFTKWVGDRITAYRPGVAVDSIPDSRSINHLSPSSQSQPPEQKEDRPTPKPILTTQHAT